MLDVTKKLSKDNKYNKPVFLHELCSQSDYDKMKINMENYFNIELINNEKLYISVVLFSIIQVVDLYINLLDSSIENINNDLLNLHDDVMYNNVIYNKITKVEDGKKIEYNIVDYYICAVDTKNDSFSDTYKLVYFKETKKWNVYPNSTDEKFNKQNFLNFLQIYKQYM